MKTKISLLVILFYFAIINCFSQRNPDNNLVGVQQLDPRFTFSIEKRWSDIADREFYYFYVINNTSDIYKLVIEVDLNLNCHEAKPYKLGWTREVYLKPNGEFTPKDDYDHSYFVSDDNEKKCLVTDGNTPTLYRGHTWQILSVINVTQEKANAEKIKKEAETVRLKKIEDEKNAKEEKLKKDAETARLKKIEDEKKASDERLKKEILNKKAKEDLEKNKKSNDPSPNKSGNSNDKKSNKDETSNKDEAKQKALEDAQEQKRIVAEAKAAEEQRKRQEEDEANQKRQSEYDAWKSTAQKEKDQQDIQNATETIAIFTLLGGFIYNGMDNVNPDYVYVAPKNKYTPLFFITNNFGFSFSLDPLLFPSKTNTLVGGKNKYSELLTTETGYYLNLNAESKIGAGNDYYSFYGLLFGKIGVVPTLSGMQYCLGGGGGIDFGFKNFKLFGQYRNNFVDSKSLTRSDVEESGEADYDMPSTEMNYGIKFTFGGNPQDKFRRGHIFLGILEKSFEFEKSGNQSYFDTETKTIKHEGKPSIKGYSFEWRQDNTFSLYFRFYDDYTYIGNTNKITNVSSTLESSSSYFEIGFVRSLDFFSH